MRNESREVIVTVHDDPSPSAYYPPEERERNGAADYSVTIDLLDGTRITSGITLYRDEVNGGMSTCGTPLDVWCGGPIVTWLRTLTDRSSRAVIESLAGGPGIERIEIEGAS